MPVVVGSQENKVVKVNFQINLGLRKAGKAKELAARIEHASEQAKAETGEGLNLSYFKQPWRANIQVSVEGYLKTVRFFTSQLRVDIEKIGLKVVPENWYEI